MEIQITQIGETIYNIIWYIIQGCAW